MALDWQDLWIRVRRMVWAAAVLGGAGLTVGLWVYGAALDSWHGQMPGTYADLMQPNGAQEAIRVLIGGLREWETAAMVLWAAAVVWVYLVPEVSGRRQAAAALWATVGLAAALIVDKVGPDWGARDQFVRFGVLMGTGCYLGIGRAVGERGRRLGRRVLEGAVTGGAIGLLSAYGVEVSHLTAVPGASPEAQAVLPPVVWGLVVGWAVTGSREVLGGPLDLAAALRQRWPLALGVLLVLVNSVGPVLMVQMAYGGSSH